MPTHPLPQTSMGSTDLDYVAVWPGVWADGGLVLIGENRMPKYMLDYIRLCSTCSMDVRTTGNMLSIVIPSLQAHASALRSAIATVPEGCPELEEDAGIVESAVRAGFQRCRPQPVQQDLFAA